MGSEQELINKIKKGDRDALSQVVKTYAGRLYTFIYWQVDKNQERAEEIFQETFTNAIVSIRRFKGKSTIYTWLCGIAKHKITDFLRNKGKGTIINYQARPELAKLIRRLEEEKLPDEVAEWAEVKELVKRALVQLPPHYQEHLVLKYIEHYSEVEIARRVGRSIKAVEAILHRARRALKKALLKTLEYE